MIEQYTGIPSDYVIIGLAALVLLLIILQIVHVVQMGKMKKAYNAFMQGKEAASLEEILFREKEEIEHLTEVNEISAAETKRVEEMLGASFQRYGLVKYDALNEMGGKLSFTLCMLTEKKDGFIMNVVHSREGCYTYIKEVIGGNAITALAREEEQALQKALEDDK